MKKTLVFLTLLALTTTAVFAQPKIGIEFKETIESEYTDNVPSGDILSITEFKAKAKYSFDSFYITPWIKGKAEVQVGDLDLYPTIGLDMGYTLSELLTIGLNNEFYFQSNSTAGYIEREWTPKLYANGAAGSLEYSIVAGPEVTFLQRDPEDDKTTIDIEAALEVVYGLPVDAVGISIVLADEFNYSLEHEDDNDGEIENDGDLLFVFDLNGLSPFLGYTNELFYSQSGESDFDQTRMFNGVKVGAVMSKDNWSVGIDYEYGYEAELETTQSDVEVWIKCKF